MTRDLVVIATVFGMTFLCRGKCSNEFHNYRKQKISDDLEFARQKASMGYEI
jgi:hypothetical protein